MKKFPNQEGLNRAFNAYRSAMRSFIISHLRQIPGTNVESVVVNSLNDRRANEVKRALTQSNRNIESAIDINDFPHLVNKNWYDAFELQLNDDSTFRNHLWLITECRNEDWAHPPEGDAEDEGTRAHLFLIANVLGKINIDARREVEGIRNQLFVDNAVERLETVEQENTELQKRLRTMLDPLEVKKAEKVAYEKGFKTASQKLAGVETERTELEERLKTRLSQLEAEKSGLNKQVNKSQENLKRTLTWLTEDAAEAEKTKNQLDTVSEQLTTTKTMKTELEECLKAKSIRLGEVEAKLAACDERLTRTLKKLEAVQAEKTKLQEYLVEIEEYLQKAEVETTEYEGHLPEIEGHLPHTNIPDCITFQGTVFTKHLNKYYVVGDDITRTFWHYWHAQGRDGKEKMRDAGWSVERIDGDWKITISPEDLQAWIADEVTELNNLLNSSRSEELPTQVPRSFSERTALPTGKEMERPALEYLADRREHRRVKIINRLTEHFSLTDGERSSLSRTGQAEKHLMNKGLVERTRTGFYRITAHGLKVLQQNPDETDF